MERLVAPVSAFYAHATMVTVTGDYLRGVFPGLVLLECKDSLVRWIHICYDIHPKAHSGIPQSLVA